MKKFRSLIVSGVLLLAISGCISSGVVDLGHDKHVVSFNSLGGAHARAWSYQVAMNRCREQEREFLQLSESYSEVRGSATSTVIFKCLAKEDPQLTSFRNYTH